MATAVGGSSDSPSKAVNKDPATASPNVKDDVATNGNGDAAVGDVNELAQKTNKLSVQGKGTVSTPQDSDEKGASPSDKNNTRSPTGGGSGKGRRKNKSKKRSGYRRNNHNGSPSSSTESLNYPQQMQHSPNHYHANGSAFPIHQGGQGGPQQQQLQQQQQQQQQQQHPQQPQQAPAYWTDAALARYQAQVMAAYAAQYGASVPYYSLDVECVATGPRHNQRTPAQVALVDQWERVLLNFYIKPKDKVFSYLPKLTGLNEKLLSKGVDLATALHMVRSTLPPNAILVGQNILKDVNWLGLVESKDFAGLQDLSGLWRAYNEKYKSFTYFSLHHEAKALLGIVQEEPHNAATDAILSIRLFNVYKRLEGNKAEMARAHKLLLDTEIEASFAKNNPTYDGVCMGNKKTCKCGAPFFF